MTFTEAGAVQGPLTSYAVAIGWEELSQDDAIAMRRGEAGLFLYPVLREKLLQLNPELDDAAVDDVILQLETIVPDITGNEAFLLWLRGTRSVYIDREKRSVDVVLVDFENPEENALHVSQEWQYTNGQHTNRADVMFVLNGIPIALVETKSARKRDGIDRGLKQVRRYHAETPELLAAPQVFEVTHLLHFYYAATWALERRNLFNWRDEEPGDFERKVKRFFQPARFLRVLRDYIAFIRKDDQLSKIILRQHQVRGAEKVVQRVNDTTRRRGLVWHTQGSGKTLTMMTVARLLLTKDDTPPLVVMVVDRNELEAQLFQNLQSYGIDTVEVARSKSHLTKILRSDFRGLVLSMIHKFDKMPKDIQQSDDVVVLIDEAHRSTGGDLGTYLMAALPNATLIGFTGTPIDRTAHGSGTFKTFGVDDPDGYLDRYRIAESIEDGTTLPLHYSLAPNEMLIPADLLEAEFLSVAETEGISDIEDLNRILDRAVNLKSFLKGNARVDQVAEYVANHFREKVQPLGYKAFLVAVDREGCALYKTALDRILPPEASTVVVSPSNDDGEELRALWLTEDRERDVRRQFVRPGTDPQILIVTEKLLTGFDAPILYCMYLDKPMRDHTLLQAIARVNRPYEVEDEATKPSGFVLDFVGLFDKLERALEFDSAEVSAIVKHIDVLFSRFETLMNGQVREYLSLLDGRSQDKAVEAVVAAFADKDDRDTFIQVFREVQTLFEVLSPDAALRDYIVPYQTLVAIYDVVKAAFSISGAPIADVARKTELLVRQHVVQAPLADALPVYEINAETMAALSGDADNGGKVFNLARSLIGRISPQERDQPFLIPVRERAVRVLEQFENRQLGTKEALDALGAAVDEYLAAQQEVEDSGFDKRTFAIYWSLRQAGLADARDRAPEIANAMSQFAYVRDNEEQRREARAEVYAVLLAAKSGTPASLRGAVDQVFRALRLS